MKAAGPLPHRWSLLLASTLASLLLAEVILRWATPYPIHGDRNRRFHPHLGWVADSHLPEIDARGFRNPPGTPRSDVVALGDSQTYGFHVPPADSWPSCLARMTGRTVYNHGLGGYGPLQYRYLAGDALTDEPRDLILALYPANDLADAWQAIDRSWPDDPEDGRPPVAACRDLESRRKSSLVLRVSALASFLDDRWRLRSHLLSAEKVLRVTISGRTTSFDRRRLARRAAFSDLEDGCILSALQETERLLLQIHDMAARVGAGFGVLLLPSKELVYSELVGGRAREELSVPARRQLVVTGRLQRALKEAGVPVGDPLPCLRRAVRRGDPVYPAGIDDHPRRAGHDCYAEAARRLLVARSPGGGKR